MKWKTIKEFNKNITFKIEIENKKIKKRTSSYIRTVIVFYS
jgi:hypothetical protein